MGLAKFIHRVRLAGKAPEGAEEGEEEEEGGEGRGNHALTTAATAARLDLQLRAHEEAEARKVEVRGGLRAHAEKEALNSEMLGWLLDICVMSAFSCLSRLLFLEMLLPCGRYMRGAERGS